MLSRLTTWYSILRALLLVLGALIYCVSPIDVVPDALPIAGWLDDLVILATGLANLVAVLRKQPAPDEPASLR